MLATASRSDTGRSTSGLHPGLHPSFSCQSWLHFLWLLAAVDSSLSCSPDGLAHIACPWGQLEEHLGSGGATNCTMCAVWHGVGGHTTVFEPSGCRHGTLLSHKNAGKACYGPSGWRHCTPRMDDPAIEGLVGAWACSWVYGTLSCALSSCCWQQLCRICTEYWCKTVGWSTSVAKEEADMGTDS